MSANFGKLIMIKILNGKPQQVAYSRAHGSKSLLLSYQSQIKLDIMMIRILESWIWIGDWGLGLGMRD